MALWSPHSRSWLLLGAGWQFRIHNLKFKHFSDITEIVKKNYPVSPSVGTTGPVGPVVPVGPVGPVGTLGSVGPVGPVGTLGSVGPVGFGGPSSSDSAMMMHEKPDA